MNIFRATVADVPRMMQCAKDCCDEHGEEVLGGKFDAEGYEAAWKALLAGDGVMFLVEDATGKIVGGIGGATGLVTLTGKKRALSLFWYMDKAHRSGLTAIRLLDRFEQWAKDSGCQQITMPINDGMSKSSGKVYERRGFTPIEVTYRKML
jgi:GNAT superfamily N-acetyltransferase